MKPSLADFPSREHPADTMFEYKMIVWKMDFEASLIAKVKRTKDTISMGEKLLTADILGLDYPTFFREILGEEDV